MYSFGDMAISIFRHFGLKLPIRLFPPIFGKFRGHIFPHNMGTIVLTQKDHPCAETCRLSHKAWRSVQRFDLGAGSRKKVETVNKKSQSGNISLIYREAPTAPIETKICLVGHLADLFTYAKFQDDIFRGYDFTGGRISHFPIDFCMGLTTSFHYFRWDFRAVLPLWSQLTTMIKNRTGIQLFKLILQTHRPL